MALQSSARDQLVGHARRLFSERGYHGTSVADVQAAAGLAPGSGALYKHFRSKAELRDAVLASPAPLPDPLPDDPEETLPAIGRRLLGGEALGRSEEALADWLRAQVLAGRLRDHDCDAVAALLAGALGHRRAAAALLGVEPPARPGRDRLLDAWLDLALTALDPRRDLED